MHPIRKCDVPQHALLGKYCHGSAYADCYVTAIARDVSHAEYVEAFYTTPLFKAERLLLSWLVSKSSTDGDVRELACGTRNEFAAWSVEARTMDQLLLSDFQGRTRSWLMVASAGGDAPGNTLLYFGSAVVPAVSAGSETATLGLTFRLLLGFHKLYSRALLSAAKVRLTRMRLSEH